MNQELDTQRGSGVSRRTVVKGAAWSVPAVAVASIAPSVAASKPPCPFGNSYVALYSPGSSLQDRPGGASGGYTIGSCTTNGPACSPTGGYTLTSAAAIGLQVSNINVSHDITTQNTGAVTLSLAADSCCNITSVKAHVHRFGSPTDPDCPTNYCQTATTGGTYLEVTGGSYGSKSVTVRPNPSTSGACSPTGIHWGSPNTDADCPGSLGFVTSGQPYGFLLIELSCV